MQVAGRRVKVDWGHLVVLAAIAGATIWYILDARSVSTEVNNLLLIQPLSIAALLLCAFILPQCFHIEGAARPEPRTHAETLTHEQKGAAGVMQPKLPTERLEMLKMLAMGALLGVYVFSLQRIGFDAATFLFILVGMLVCGERRPLPLAVFPVAVTAVVIYGFKSLLPYPLPTVVF